MTSAILCYHTINPTISTLTKDELVQQIRGQIVHQIRGILFEFFWQVSSGTPQVLGDTPNSVYGPEEYLRSYVSLLYRFKIGFTHIMRIIKFILLLH